ncbi:MAG: V-type ATP synthase subunit F [Clostridiales bacterium]|nr:V-type ATP synthase subunit F [Clostridiales bacterium]
MYKVCVIGDRDSVLGFKAVGFDAFPCIGVDEAKKALSKAAKEGYAIVFITEGYAKKMLSAIDQYKEEKLPAIVPIPGMDGNFGVGFGKLKKSVERAVGADILFGGEHK